MILLHTSFLLIIQKDTDSGKNSLEIQDTGKRS